MGSIFEMLVVLKFFVGLKSTSQSCEDPFIVSKSVFKMKTLVLGY